MVLIFLFYVIIACVMIVGKQVGMYSTPWFLVAIRLMPAGVIFLCVDYFKNKKLRLPTLKSWDSLLIVLYSFNILFVDFTRLKGLSYIPSSNAALISMTAPFFAVFFSWKFFGEHVTAKKIGALILGVCGVMPLIVSHMQLGHQSITDIILGYGFILLATVGIIVSGIFAKHLIAQKGYQLFTITGLVMLGGGFLGLISSLTFDQWTPVPLSNFSVTIPLILFLFFSHSLVAFPLYTYLVQKYPITLVSFAQCIMPFLTAIMGWFLVGEVISLMFFLSFCILILSLYIFYQEELKEGLISK